MKNPVFLFFAGAVIGGMLYAWYLKSQRTSVITDAVTRATRPPAGDCWTRWVFNGASGQYECPPV